MMDRYNDRSAHSEERDQPPAPRINPKYKTNTLPIDMGRERCVSMPSGHYAATPRHARGKSPNLSMNGDVRTGFLHYGSSLSLSNGSTTSDLTSRTLRPPSPTTLRKSSIPGKPTFPSKTPHKPALPSLNSVELKSPKLADYLEKPRLVSIPSANLQSRLAASEHHAKRMNALNTNYRNLRLGNFIDSGESNDEELIPERLRMYYLDTYLNVCDTCESKTHLDPTSPIQRGM